MITRIEIDGFKSFVDFSMDVPPFLALLGSNASGKSNFIDTLRAMADLAGGDTFGSLYVAGRGTPTEMFHQRADGSRVPHVRFGCGLMVDAPELAGIVGLDYTSEVLYESTARGERIIPTNAYLTAWNTERLEMLQERGGSEEALQNLTATRNRLLAGGWNSDIMGLPPAALSGASFEKLSDSRQRATWLLARELRGWQFLSLVPSEMRDRALVTDNGPLDSGGSNLAAVLGRISGTDAMWDLVSDAVALIPGLHDVSVLRSKEYWEYELEFRGTGRISARMASDGTLRVLAVLAALHDPDHPGVLVLDEIENGLHPARLTELLRRIRSRVTDWRLPGPVGSPMRQVIFSTHSPVVLAALFPEHADDLRFLTAVFHPWEEDGRRFSSLITRVRSVGEPDPNARGARVSISEIKQILEYAQPMEPVG
jgi:predicted ATPase